MCLLFFSYRQHPRYPLVVLANRDEFYNRPTEPARFWAEHPHVLAGKDTLGGGTWLGVTRQGYLAMLTNYRAMDQIKPNAPTRGKLVSDYLVGEFDPKEYLLARAKTAYLYNGYNLLVGTVADPWFYSSQGNKLVQLGTGLYGISNGAFNNQWPKITSGKKALQPLLAQDTLDIEALFAVMQDTQKAPDHLLPQTGLSLPRERALSARFIQTDGYGTRCSTLILVDAAGTLTFIERPFEQGVYQAQEQRFEFRLP